MMNSQLLEWANGLIFAIDVGMATIIARYLIEEVRNNGYSRIR